MDVEGEQAVVTASLTTDIGINTRAGEERRQGITVLGNERCLWGRSVVEHRCKRNEATEAEFKVSEWPGDWGSSLP